MVAVLEMKDADLNGKRVLIRLDLNVPHGDETATAVQFRDALPTIKAALKQGGHVMVASHRGRPAEGDPTDKDSLQSLVSVLAGQLDVPVRLAKDYLDGVKVRAGEVVVLENVAFNKGEKGNDETLARKYAALCDVFVMDALGVADKARASLHGVAKFAPVACAGPRVVADLALMDKMLKEPARPVVAVVGGNVHQGWAIMENLSDIADTVVVGHEVGVAFLAASGVDVGDSILDKDFIPKAKEMMAKSGKGEVVYPTDVLVGKELANHRGLPKTVDKVGKDECILDLGSSSTERAAELLKEAKTIVWYGPMGAFEFSHFEGGTKRIAQAIADSKAQSLAIGNDAAAALRKFGYQDKVQSRSGSAYKALLEGKPLSAIDILQQRAK
ncbi:phosphoglycerate kinase [Streptomyces sp. NPDC054787]